MNPLSLKDAEKLFKDTAKLVSKIKKAEIVACVPYIYLEKLRKLSLGRSRTLGHSSTGEPGEAKKISLGAQNCFYEEKGAFTGEISPEMLANLGVKYVILGHSERRARGETSVDVNKKIKAALVAGLKPVVCVGEISRDENHEYFNLVKMQLEESLDGISKHSIEKVIIAYEPVWALSSTLPRKDATSMDAREMNIFIRKVLSDKFGSQVSPRVIYGGSANEKDAEEFLTNGGVDGLLPGKASLDPKRFAEIVKIADKCS